MRAGRGWEGVVALVSWALLGAGCETVSLRPEGARSESAREAADEREEVAGLAPPGVRATAVAAGLFHSCAILEGGAVACWGQNIDGVVDGSGDAGRVFAPTRVDGAEGARTIRVTRDKSCVGRDDGELVCWGRYAIARPHGGGTGTLGRSLGATDFGLGGGHACGRSEAGRVRCLGANDFGQRASRHARYEPHGRANEVEGLDGVRAVATGRAHTCALLASGGVRCFGSGGMAQLGDGREAYRVFGPRDVASLDDAVEIAAHPDGFLTCSLRRSGAIACWGSRGTPRDEGGLVLVGREPVALPELDGVGRIFVGLWEVCAITEEHRAFCFAESLASVRGEPDAPPFGEPREIEGMPPVADLALGAGHACALSREGHVICWGSNEYGQLGDGTTEPRDEKVVVALDGGGS